MATSVLRWCIRCRQVVLPSVGSLSCTYHPGKRVTSVHGEPLRSLRFGDFRCCGQQSEDVGCTACDHTPRGSFIADHLPPAPAAVYMKPEHATYLGVTLLSLEAGKLLESMRREPTLTNNNNNSKSLVLVARYDVQDALRRGGELSQNY